MKVLVKEQNAVIGINVSLDTVDLRLLKDKWNLITDEFPEEFQKTLYRDRMMRLKPLVEEMTVFMSQLFTDVSSTQEVHDSLFKGKTIDDIKIEEPRVVGRIPLNNTTSEDS